MNKVNKIVSFLPIVIILYWLSSLVFFVDSEFYNKNFFELNLIDTIVTALSLVHAFFYWWDYKKVSKYCVRAIITLILVTFLHEYVNQNFYYFLYYWVIVTTVFESIRANCNE